MVGSFHFLFVLRSFLGVRHSRKIKKSDITIFGFAPHFNACFLINFLLFFLDGAEIVLGVGPDESQPTIPHGPPPPGRFQPGLFIFSVKELFSSFVDRSANSFYYYYYY